MNSRFIDMNVINDIKVPSTEFNRIIGHIEDIVIGPTFQQLQMHFLDKHCMQFFDEEENRIYYMDIFNEYTSSIEELIVKELETREPNVDLNSFLDELKVFSTKFDGEIFEFLYSLSDFETFKSLMLDHKEFKLNENRFAALGDCFTVKSLQQ